jgi:hypothetical protein
MTHTDISTLILIAKNYKEETNPVEAEKPAPTGEALVASEGSLPQSLSHSLSPPQSPLQFSQDPQSPPQSPLQSPLELPSILAQPLLTTSELVDSPNVSPASSPPSYPCIVADGADITGSNGSSGSSSTTALVKGDWYYFSNKKSYKYHITTL